MNKLLLLALLIPLQWITTEAFAQHKGITFQGVLKRPDGSLPTVPGLTVNLKVLTPSGCVLRDEDISGVNIANGYINLVIGKGTTNGGDPGKTIQAIMNNTTAFTGLNCLDSNNNVLSAGQTYTPTSIDARKLRLSLTLDGNPVIMDFNMRAIPYAVNSETLNGKTDVDFANINTPQGVTQTNLESVFARFTKLDSILNNFDGTGAVLTGNATNVTGTVAVANGGTGATTAAAARTNLGLGPLATMVPTGTADNTTYLRGDGTWATGSGGGAVTSVAGRTGVVTLTSADLTDFNAASDTRADGRITAQKGIASGLASLDGSGKVPSTQLALVAADIPNLDAAKITSGTITQNVSATSVAGTTGTFTNLRVYDGTANFLTQTAPAAGFTANYTVQWPAAIGTSGQALQISSVAGAVATLGWVSPTANAVTGTGTTNYLPMFTAASTLANSPIAASGGNVGIGTTSPNTALDLNGAFSARGFATGTYAAAPASQGRIFYDSTLNKFQVSQNTGSYSDLLTSTGANGTYFKQGGNGFGTGANLGSSDAQPLNLITSGTTKMTIDTVGRIVMAPTTFDSTGDTGLTVSNNMSSVGAATGNYVGEALTTSWGAGTNSPTANLIGLDVSTTKTGAGSVNTMAGINLSTTSIQANPIANAYGIKSTYTQALSGATTNAFGGYFTNTISGGTITNSYGIYIDAIAGTNKWSLYANDSTAPSYFAGNVGIGTIAPNTALDLNGALSVRGIAAPAVSVAGQGRIYFDSTSNTFKVSQNNGAYVDLVGSGGTVTSVGLALPAEITVSNSPVTTTGTLTGAWANQTTNKVFAAPSGSTGTPTFRSLVNADLPVIDIAHGGTGLSIGTSGGIPYFDATTTMASSAALTANGVVLGGGAGASPTATAAGAAYQPLRIPAGGGAPAFGALDLSQAAAVTGTLPVGNGGTGVTSFTNYSVVASNGSGAVISVPGTTAGSLMQYSVTGPVWTTAAFPVSTTANQLLYSSATNVVGGLATANSSILKTDGSGVPSWGAISSDVFTQYAILAGRASGQSLSGGTAASENLTLDSTAHATKGYVLLNANGGKVGIGNSAPRGTLDVSGTVLSKAATLNGTTTIDFGSGNLQYTASNCGAFILHNLKDGGAYMFAVQGTSITTCSFTAFSDAGSTALTVHLPPDHADTTSGKHTVYNLAVLGGHVYVAWTPGY